MALLLVRGLFIYDGYFCMHHGGERAGRARGRGGDGGKPARGSRRGAPRGRARVRGAVTCSSAEIAAADERTALRADLGGRRATNTPHGTTRQRDGR
jgi:hypothetical protein